MSNTIKVGDKVRIISIPPELPQGLPEEDQEAINAQKGKILVVQEVNENSYAELEFTDTSGQIHTIWLKFRYLEKIKG